MAAEKFTVMSEVVDQPSSAFSAAECGVGSASDTGRLSVPSVVPLK